MRRNSITFNLLCLIISAFIVTTVSVLFIGDIQLTRIIDESQDAVYAEKIEAIWGSLHRNNERLKKTGLVEAYAEDFKEASLKILRQTYYRHPDQLIYPFIVDADGKVVMHPVLPQGDLSLEQTEFVGKMLASSEGDFDYTYRGQKKWCLFKQFPEWNWVIAYTVPLDIKYGDAREFRNLLVYIMGGIAFLVLLVLSLIVTRFTRPITRLTNVSTAMADGDLDQQIDLRGADEVGTLARSFSHMRDSIQHTISELEKENIERRKAQVDLADEKERLSVTLRSIGDGVITTDISGNIVLLNKVTESLTGWSSEEAAGRPLEEVFHIINEQTREKCENPATIALSSGQIVGLANRTVLIARDGRERNIADSGAPILDAESNIIGAVLVFRDVTEQIRTEKELLKVKKLESIGVLASGIAHDFNNILTAILGNINLALFDDDLKVRTKKLLSEAEKASLMAKDLTQQLLTFAKGGDPVKEVSSLESVIKDSADFVLHGDKVACRYDIPEDLCLVNIDKGQISQVVQNIVLNASHAMPEGGIIKITCENLSSVSKKVLPFAKDGRFIKICIQDSGIGMPENVVEKIFDPYFSTKHGGSGLGLAITQSIITKHGGHISVESTPGVGSTFSIYLPVSEKTKTKKQESLVEHKASSPAKILIMDDEEMVRTVAKEMLIQLGHEVGLAADGKEALQLYQESKDSGRLFDLVILDLTIPGGMGGKEAIKEILKIDSNAKVIVSSGYSNDPVMANFRDYGFCSAIVKPYQLQKLSKVISQLLD